MQGLEPENWGTDSVTNGHHRHSSFGYASQPHWRIPLANGIGHLSVAERGLSREVLLNGEFIGIARRARFAEPWTEFTLDRDGHTIVVAQVFGLNRLATTQDSNSTAQVFVDGIHLRGHGTLDEWRLKSAHPIDRYAFATEVGFRGLGQHHGWEGALVWIGVGLTVSLLQGWGAPGVALAVVFMSLGAAWFEGLAVIQDNLRTRHDWTFWQRMALFLASFVLFVVPIGVLAWTTLQPRSTSRSA